MQNHFIIAKQKYIHSAKNKRQQNGCNIPAPHFVQQNYQIINEYMHIIVPERRLGKTQKSSHYSFFLDKKSMGFSKSSKVVLNRNVIHS